MQGSGSASIRASSARCTESRWAVVNSSTARQSRRIAVYASFSAWRSAGHGSPSPAPQPARSAAHKLRQIVARKCLSGRTLQLMQYSSATGVYGVN